MTKQDFIYPDKEKILRYCESFFLTNGFHKTTINEISKQLSISKNTFYKYFPNKDKLVEEVIIGFISNVNVKIQIILNTESNAIEKFIKMLVLLTNSILKIKDNFMREIQLHLPNTWLKIDDKRKIMMNKNLMKLIEQGKKEKLIKDLPSDVIVTVFISSIRSVVNPGFILNANYHIDDVIKITFGILLNGILTEKGKMILENLKIKL
jgi:AcrR family transcriptional regulator